MAALAAAFCPFAGGVPRRARTVLSQASEHAFGKKHPRVAPARDSSSASLTKTTCNSVVTAAGEMSCTEVLEKRLASELDALHGFLKKAELISQRGACKGGAPPIAGKKVRFLASNQRLKPIQEDFKAPSVKKRKISTLVVVEHKQKQKEIRAPRMSPQERNQIAGRLSKDEKVAEERKDNKIAEERKDDKVSEERKDKKVAEERKDNKVAEESKEEKVAEKSKGEVVREKKEEEYADISGGLSRPIETGSKRSSSSSGDSDQTKVLQQSTEANKVQDVQQRAAHKAVDMRRLLYRANLRRQLLEMEKAVLPDQRIDPRDLQRLGIKEYGHPSLMCQLGFVVKVDA